MSRLGHRLAAYLLAGVTCLLASAPTLAFDVRYRHLGTADPATEGWSAPSSVSIPVGPVTDQGVGAWQVDDDSTASGSTAGYSVTPTASELSGAFDDGWILRTTLRVVDANDAIDFSIYAEYNNGAARYLMAFGSNAAGEPMVQLIDGVSTQVHTVTGSDGGFHTYELVYEPLAGTARLLVDGEPTALTAYAGATPGAVPVRLNWGGGQSSSTGHAYFHRVEWEIATDADQDSILDILDNCPFVQNNPNMDSGGIGPGSAPDGIGDACQCGDLTGDGVIDAADVARLRAALADPEGAPLSAGEALRCSVYGEPEDCDILTVTLLERAVAGLSPGLEQTCGQATGFGAACGDGVCAAGESCEAGGCQLDCGACLLGSACAIDRDCASGVCSNGVCQAVAVDPAAPRCGDGVCNGRETCSRVGLHGCYDDCGPCTANTNPNDGVNPDYCIADNDCAGGALCMKAGRCIDNPGILCVENGDCPADDSCNPYAFVGNVYKDSDFDGLCSDFSSTCDPGVWNETFFNRGELVQAQCEDGDLCRERRICHPPLEEACGQPPTFAERCDSGRQCSDNADCKSGVCHNWILYIPGLVDPEYMSVCTAGPVPNGTPCLESQDCASGICNLGYCVANAWPNGTPCSTDAACLSGDCGLEQAVPLCVENSCGDGVCSDLESCSKPVTQYPNSIRRCTEDCGLCPTGHRCNGDDECASGDCGFELLSSVCKSVCGDGICDAGEACTTNVLKPLGDFCKSDCGACANGYRCDADSDCAAGNCEQGYCAPKPPTCNDIGNCSNGSLCSRNSDCASDRCIGPPGGDKYCIQSGCIAPGSYCGPGSSGSCCDFPGTGLSCTGFPSYYCNVD